MHKSLPIFLVALAAATAQAAEGPTAMSAQWAEQMCSAWNAEPVLTDKLAESGWIKNDAGRGFKTMQVWRSDCDKSAHVELRIALKDGKAQCVYGGALGTQAFDRGADYQMWAQTARWKEMGAGEYGPMKAMMFKRLEFDGPKFEAMGNMGPFESFLRLVGKVPGDWASCPM